MGRCLEFATTITAGCNHPMEAQSDCCTCSVCGTRCTGKFGGCPAVWAAVTAPSPLVVAEPEVSNDLRWEGVATQAGAVAVMDSDLAIDWDSSEFEPHARPKTAVWRPPEPRSPDSKRRLTAVAIVVALIGAGLGVMLAAGGGSEPAPVSVAANRPPELQFAPVTISDGVTMDRNWRLEGSNGHRFIGTLTFSNTTDAAVPVTFNETLPKTLADTIDVVLFDPFPTVINPDPVVQWNVVVEANSTVVVTYEISVPPDGARAARLDQWAKDLEAEQASALADAQAALEAAQTEAERAYAQALLDAARQSHRSFNPTPNAPGCTYCGGGGGGGTTPTFPTTEDTPLPTIPEETTTTPTT